MSEGGGSLPIHRNEQEAIVSYSTIHRSYDALFAVPFSQSVKAWVMNGV